MKIKLKLWIIAFVLLMNIKSKAQVFPLNGAGEIEFSEVIESKLPKEKLHSNAKEWVLNTFGDYKKAVQLEDNENFKIIVSWSSNVDYISGDANSNTKESINYTITIECKDNKYRYRINNISVNSSFSILDSFSDVKIISPVKHITNIESSGRRLEELKKVDSSKMKKKEQKEHNDLIQLLENNINDEKIFYAKEYDAIDGILISIKNNMNKSEDF